MDPYSYLYPPLNLDQQHQSLHDSNYGSVTYRCGCCNQVFQLFCKLHAHLQHHPAGGSFYYDHVSRTAFPKYDTTCNNSQTTVSSASTNDNPAVETLEKVTLGDLVDCDNKLYGNFGDCETQSFVEVNLYAVQDINLNGDSCSGFDDTDVHAQDMIETGSVLKDLNEDELPKKVDIKLDREETVAEQTTNTLISETSTDSDCLSLEKKTEDLGIKTRSASLKSKSQQKKKNQFKCKHKLCSKKDFESQTELCLHNAVHSGKALYSCHICNKKFVHLSHLVNIHLKQHETVTEGVALTKHMSAHEESFKCKVCETVVATEDMLTEHRAVHDDIPEKISLKKTKKFSCEICQKVLSSESTLQSHKQTHAEVKPYSCTKCIKTFASKQGLVFHKTTHTGRKYVCKICGRKYGQEYTLRNHMVNHKGDSGFECEKCGKCFAIKSMLSKHLQSHNKEKRFTCEVCGFQTHCQNSLKMHCSTHGENRFKCGDCNKAFSRKNALLEHMHTHLGIKPFVCEFCAMSFSYQSSLISHRRIHTGDKPYKCEKCSRCFSLRHIYKRHLLTHTRERPYKCTQCDKAFTQEYNRTVHMRQHTGEKPFPCNFCTRAFAQNCSLKSHMRSHYENL